LIVPGIALVAALAIVGVGAVRALARRQGASRAASDPARDAFDAALNAQRRGRYHDAREGYLHALSLDPQIADARYQLVLLTHAAGANDEEQLELISPNDPRLPGLRDMVSEPRGTNRPP
jgi:hypothetical protein